jgi:hypothetical protein
VGRSIYGNVIGVGATHAPDNEFVDGRENRIRIWIAWVRRLGERKEEGVVVSLLYIITLWVPGHGLTVVTIEITGCHCCGCEKDLWTGDCEPRKYRVSG